MEGIAFVNNDLCISVEEWLASDATDPFERDTNADFSITIGQTRATEVEDIQAGTVRKTIRASAGLLAIWLADNWWRLTCEPDSLIARNKDLNWRMSHTCTAIGGGYVWPNLIFGGSDGSSISIECKSSIEKEAAKYSPVRYLNSFSSIVSVEDFKTGVSAFVELVLERLASRGTYKSKLHDIWKDIRDEQSNQKASQYRRLEALLGLDADEEEELIPALLKKWPKKVGMNALEEISAAVGSSVIEGVLTSTKEAAQSVKTFVRLPSLGQFDEGSGTPWRRGQAAAYALRHLWELDFGPIRDETLADRLEITPAKLNQTVKSAPFSMAVRSEAHDGIGLVLNRLRPESHRFDIARLIGDHIYSEASDQLRPATTAFTVRQKFQRAFAAEFLCPSEKIKERFSQDLGISLGGDMVADLASEYQVSEQVVVHHLENRDVFSREIAKDAVMFA